MIIKRLITVSIVLLLSANGSNRAEQKKLIDVDPSYQKRSENRLVELVNQERRKRGLPVLKSNPDLEQIALGHSIKMGKENQLRHNFPRYPDLVERMVAKDLHFSNSGENVAYSTAVDPELIHKGFMDSPPHKRNILTRAFTHVGIRMINTEQGFWVTQEFATLSSPPSVETAKAIVIQHVQDIISDLRGYEPVIIREIEDALVQVSVDFLNNRKGFKQLPSYDRFNIVAPSLDEVIPHITQYIKNLRLMAFAAGVHFARTRQYRGGVWSVSIAFNKDTVTRGLSEKEIENYILTKINRIRKQNQLNQLAISQQKSRLARKTAGEFYRNRQAKPAINVSFIIYETRTPLLLSNNPEHRKILLSDGKTAGIGIYYPERHGKRGNYCIIAILI